MVDAVVQPLGAARIALHQNRGQLGRARIGIIPGQEQRLAGRHQGLEIDDVEVGRDLRQGLRYREIVGGRNLQVGQQAIALEVRHVRRPIGRARITEVAGVELAGIEQHVIDAALRAVAAGEGRLGVQDVIARGGDVDHRRIEIDRDDIQLAEGEELVRIAHTVLVQVAPHPKLAELCVQCIDDAVAVAVEVAQLRKAGDAGGAEQLADVADGPVAVTIERQEAVVGAQPARALGKAVTVQIEIGIGGRQAGEFQAVAVQVQRQRIFRQEHAHALEDSVDDVTERACIQR